MHACSGDQSVHPGAVIRGARAKISFYRQGTADSSVWMLNAFRTFNPLVVPHIPTVSHMSCTPTCFRALALDRNPPLFVCSGWLAPRSMRSELPLRVPPARAFGASTRSPSGSEERFGKIRKESVCTALGGSSPRGSTSVARWPLDSSAPSSTSPESFACAASRWLEFSRVSSRCS